MRRRSNEPSDLATGAYLNFALTWAKALMILVLCLAAMISIIAKNFEGIKPRSSYVITVGWDDGTNIDVDTWLQLPDGKLVYYGQKEVGLVTLERDDLGSINNKMTIDGKVIESKTREEIINIRGIPNGEFIFNILIYNCFESTTSGSATPGSRLLQPITVKVEIKKMNPTVAEVFTKSIRLDTVRQEIHVTRFSIDNKGEMVQFDSTLPTSLVKSKYDGRSFLAPSGALQ